MAIRLPIPGSDNGQWGTLLNDFLEVEHNSNGTLKKAADIAQAKTNAASAVTTANNAQTTANAKYTKPGGGIPATDLTTSVQSDLTSAASAVQTVNAKAGPSVTLTASDVGAASSASVAGLAQDSQVVHNTGSETIAGAKTFSSAPAVPTGAFPESAVTNLVSDLNGKVNQSLLTTKGDLLVGSGPASVVRLGVGNDGQILTTDSTKTLGLSWADAPQGGEAGTDNFSIQGNLPGVLAIGTVFPAGIRIDYAETLSSVVAWVDQESSGADITLSVRARNHSTGTDTVLGDLTITQNASRRGTLTGLSTTLSPGDRLFVDITQVGSIITGSTLGVSLLGPSGTIPTALSAPTAPTGFSALLDGNGSDINLSWTASASGVVNGYDIFRDGVFLVRATGTTFTDVNAGSQSQSHTYQLESGNADTCSSKVSATYTATSGIQYGSNLGTNIVTTTGSTITLSINKAVGVGHTLVGAIACAGPTSGTLSTFTITDSRGNTYTQDAATEQASSPTDQICIFSAPITHALSSGDTITVNMTSTTARAAITIDDFTGLKSSSYVDATAVSDSAGVFGKNLTAGSATTTAVNELAYAAWTSTSVTFTPGSGWTAGTSVATNAGSNERGVYPEYQILSGAQTVSPTATQSSSVQWAGAVVTYEGAS